jgi:hypothetical protein
MPRTNRPPKGQNPHGGKREGAGRPRGPNGRGAAFKHLRELARSHTEQAKDERLCLACANAILDRGYGKPREGDVVEQEEMRTTPYQTPAEAEAALSPEGLPIPRRERRSSLTTS